MKAWIPLVGLIVSGCSHETSIKTPADIDLHRSDAEPQTAEEYDAQMKDLRESARVARKHHEEATLETLATRIASRKAWADEHVHRQDAFYGGLALTVFGGASLLSGFVVFAAGSLQGCDFAFSCAGDPGMKTEGAIMMIGGAALTALSIPIMLSNRKKTVDTRPHTSFIVGPTRVGLSATF
jgi:hypothetical protein